MPICNHCGKRLSIVRYLALRQCGHCGQRRRLRYGLVALGGVGLVYWIQVYPVRLDFWLSWLVLVVFGVITVIDIEYRVVLFETVIAGGVVFLAIGVARHGVLSTLLGGSVGFLSMFGLYWLGKLLLKVRKRASSPGEEALGFGDVNLFTILGLLLGMPAVLVALWIAIAAAGVFSGGVVVRMWLSRNYRTDMAIPYAPFLIFGAFALLYLVRP
ncbi:MAG: A24 family peptidase [Anaerolineales bacterium]|nr:A24 family peptidase [Anaerolineales bacterium]MCS7247215.1 A24 family peptidase [Anaerolineales bacterium]MDW8161026.1 A24 family peptidase [Anaerolineales bacterium]MDW8445792.1 A24 family peptidase [Anaerolineales bacterium]